MEKIDLIDTLTAEVSELRVGNLRREWSLNIVRALFAEGFEGEDTLLELFPEADALDSIEILEAVMEVREKTGISLEEVEGLLGHEITEKDRAKVQEACKSLRSLLDYNSELPKKFLAGGQGGTADHKFRGSWFQGVHSNVCRVARILGDKQLLADADAFAEAKSSRHGLRTTQEEIEAGDRLIERALGLAKNLPKAL